jgi:hypothetical protein
MDFIGSGYRPVVGIFENGKKKNPSISIELGSYLMTYAVAARTGRAPDSGPYSGSE